MSTYVKGLEIPVEQYLAILKDPDWQKFLVFKGPDVFVDLKKYSDNKYYLPVKSEYQSSVVGFFFMTKLFKCPYRSQDDLVHIHPPRPKQYDLTIEPVYVPVFEPMHPADGPEACDYITTRQELKYKKVIRERT